MGFENTNFVDDLGHEVKEGNFFLGCLGFILIAGLFFGGIAGITAAYTYFTLSQQNGSPVFEDGKKTITFKPPEKWACFNAAAGLEPYVMNKIFVEKKKMQAVIETLPYRGIKYTKIKSKPSDVSKQVREALKNRELKTAVLATEKKEIKANYEGYKREKCVYKNGYGYSVYKKGNIARCYYFKPVKNFMMVMAYIYEDSEENRPKALAEEVKIRDMWEKAFKGNSKLKIQN